MTPQHFLPLATYPDFSSELIISNAITFAEFCGASLHVCAQTVQIPHIPKTWAPLLLDTQNLIERAEFLSHDRAARLVAEAKQQSNLAKVKLSAMTLETALPLLHKTIATQARFFDLAVVECTAAAPDTRFIAEAIIFESGRPVVIFPNSSVVARVNHLVIAWDGSRAAARGLNDAGPLLRKAQTVSVLSVSGEKSLPSDCALHLANILVSRGVNAEAIVVQGSASSIGHSIQQAALNLGGDFLVMGAFGHSRLRDFVLGGATAGVLDEPILPILMSH